MNALDELLEKLQCPAEGERIYAAEDIGYLNAAEGVPPLLARLPSEPSRAVREAIFRALARIEADAATEGSIALLEGEDPQIRNQAVEVLRHKGSAAIPFLAAAMRTGDKDIRKLVLDVISGAAYGPAKREIYDAALSDPDPNVVITAVENLGQARVREYRGRIEETLEKARHPMLSGVCLEALGGIGDESSLETIRRCFPKAAEIPDFLLVHYLKAIGALGGAVEFAEISQLLAVCRPPFQPAILSALAGIHQRHPVESPAAESVPVLRAIAEEEGDPPLCRYQSVRILGLLSDREDVRAFLSACLSSPERLVRLGAAEALRPGELLESDGEVQQTLRA
jgi:HEAT repeat protein